MRLVHTSDWQIGRQFRFADDATLAVLAEARLDAIKAVAALARREGAAIVLVAGDVYDTVLPSERTLRAPLERMRAAHDLDWHLVPGNHDPHRPGFPFERLRALGLPANVHLHVEPAPVPLGPDPRCPEAVLLPAALAERHADGDPTAWFDRAATADGVFRIGLAHGSVRGFGAAGDQGHNLLAPDRARRAGLDYLALGDWHGAQEVGDATWYSGTPETDDFGVGGRGGGEALAVALGEGDATRLSVVPHRVGRFRWHRMRHDLLDPSDIPVLDGRIRALAPALDTVLLDLAVAGRLSLAATAAFEAAIIDGVAHALRFLRLDREELAAVADGNDLSDFEHGPIRIAAERLAGLAERGDGVASRALLRLRLLGARTS